MKRKVKNIIFFSLFFILFINPIFAVVNELKYENDSLVIKVLGEVKIESYVAVIYYEEERLLNDLTILNNFNDRFNISESGRTKEFRVVIEGNQVEPRTLEVKIQGQKFVGVPGTRTANVDTLLFVNAIASSILNNITPNNNIPFISSLNVPKGIHSINQNIIETRFVLAWQGNTDLPAGFYSSDIDIEYSVID
jgi:hypothetical protein